MSSIVMIIYQLICDQYLTVDISWFITCNDTVWHLLLHGCLLYAGSCLHWPKTMWCACFSWISPYPKQLLPCGSRKTVRSKYMPICVHRVHLSVWTWLVWSEQQFIMCLWVCLHAVSSCICVCIECVSVNMVSVVKGVFAFSVGSGVMCVMWFCQGSRWMCVCVVGATSVAHSVSSGWSSGQRAEPRF